MKHIILVWLYCHVIPSHDLPSDNVCIEVMSLHITRSTLERCHSNLNTLSEIIEELVMLLILHVTMAKNTDLNKTEQKSYN